MRANYTSAVGRPVKVVKLQRFPAIYDSKTILEKLNKKARALNSGDFIEEELQDKLTELRDLRKLVSEFKAGDRVEINLYPINREQWSLIKPLSTAVHYFMNSRQNTTIRGKVLGYNHERDELSRDIRFNIIVQIGEETPILIPLGGTDCEGFSCADAPDKKGKEISYDGLPVLSVKKSSK